MGLKYIFSLLVIFFAISFSCRSPTQPTEGQELKLAAIDISSTEVFLSLITNNTPTPINIILTQDGKQLFNLTLTISDTIFDVNNLKTYNSYIFQASAFVDGKLITSNKIISATLDTTKNNFTWQTFTFGEKFQSLLYGVTIINEHDIWASGEIYIPDSADTSGETPYNVIHWDGNNWQMIKAPTYNFGGRIYPVPIKTIYAFNSQNIWTFSDAGSYSHWNGNQWTTAFLSERQGSGLKLIGFGDSSLYLVGYNGSISYFDGSVWTKLNSGTTALIGDICKYKNYQTGNEEFYCPDAEQNRIDNRILKISSGIRIDPISFTPPRIITSVWSNKGFPIFAVGDGIFTNKSGKWEEIVIPANYVSSEIRGTALNDIFIVGAYGLFVHYNGNQWTLLNNIYQANYISLDVKDNIVVAVGENNGKAVLTIGNR